MESNPIEKNDIDKSSSDSPPRNRHRRRRLILCIAAMAIIAIAITAVTLSQTIFKPKQPVTTVNSVSLKNVDASILAGVRLNITVRVDLSIRNPNRFGFKFDRSLAELRYREEKVGEAEIPGGEISGGGTEAVSFNLTVIADRLLARSEAYSDLVAGDLPMSARTRIVGKVKIGVFKIRVVSYTSCSFDVDVLSQAVTQRQCTYKTRL